jgi:hypothetical protein
MAKRKAQQQYPWEVIEGATGASDATSGGGAGAGNPEPDTIERTGGRVLRGDVNQDKKRLFPERFGKAAAGKTGSSRKGAKNTKSGAASKNRNATRKR